MSDNILGTIINAIVAIVVVWLAFEFNKKSNEHTRKLGWNETQADDFLKCSRSYSQTVSKLVVDIAIWADIYTRKEGDWKKSYASKNEEIIEHVNTLKLLNWDIKRYAEAAQKTKRDFFDKEKDLFDTTAQLINLCGNPKGHPFSLELIREKQNLFDELAKNVHAELCGI